MKNIRWILLFGIFLKVDAATPFKPSKTPETPPPPSSLTSGKISEEFKEVEKNLNELEKFRGQMASQQAQVLLQKFSAYLCNDEVLLNSYKEAYSSVYFEGAKKEDLKVKDWKEKKG